MKWHLLLVVVAALLLGADAPKQGADKPAATNLPPSNFRNVIFRDIRDAPPRFAKVEFQGFLEPLPSPQERRWIWFDKGPKHIAFPLDVSNLKDWTGAKYRESLGKVVRVMGTLDIQAVGTGRPGLTEDRVVIVVQEMKIMEKENQDPPKNP